MKFFLKIRKKAHYKKYDIEIIKEKEIEVKIEVNGYILKKIFSRFS